MSDKELVLENLVLWLETFQPGMAGPFDYFDKTSKDNIDRKIEVLTKLKNGEDLTKEEYYDRSVFELYPENNEGLIIG